MRRLKNQVTGKIILAFIFVIATMLVGKSQAAWATNVVADRVLGQPDCYTNAANIVDQEAMNSPNAVAIDKSVTPNRVFVADTSNNRVLGYASISALVNGGSASLVIGQPDFYSSSPGFTTTATSLNGPKAVAVDKAGNLYVADTGANRVLEYNKPFSSGFVAGQPADMVFGQGLDFTSNQCNFGQTSFPAQETMCAPSGLAIDSKGNLFVADTNNNRVLAFTAPFNAATDADVVYGQGGFFEGGACNQSDVSGTPPTAGTLCGPNLLAVDASNNLYVADTGNNRVLKFTTPLTNTIASQVFGQNGSFITGMANQGLFTPSSATLSGPVGVGVDGLGDVFIGDTANNRVLMFKPPIFATSPVATFVFGQSGSFITSQCNGGFGMPPSNATVCGPRGVAPDSTQRAGVHGIAHLMIADTGNNRVLKWPYTNALGPKPGASVVLGQPDFTHNSSNTVDPTGLSAPAAVAIDKSVTPNHLWVVDTGNNRVLGYTDAATFTTYSAADIVIGQPDFYSGSSNQGSFSGPTAQTLSAPNAAAVDAAGNLYVADGGNNRVLMYPKPFLSGKTANEAATVVFGQGGSFTTSAGVCSPGLSSFSLNPCPPLPPVAGTATRGGMCLPSGLALGPGTSNQTLYVSDQHNNRVLVFKQPFTPSTAPLPALELGQPAGPNAFTENYCNQNNDCGYIFPSANSLCGPDQIATDALGNLYVADTTNNRLLEYNVPSKSGASANVVFGQLGNFTGSTCNLDAEEPTIGSVTLCDAEGVAADTSTTPDIYIADTQNNRVLWFSNAPHSGPNPGAALVIGQPDFVTSLPNFGGSAPSCKSLSGPLTPAVDSLGNLYVPDAGNNRVLEYNKPDPPVATPTPKPTPKPTAKPSPTPKPAAANNVGLF